MLNFTMRKRTQEEIKAYQKRYQKEYRLERKLSLEARMLDKVLQPVLRNSMRSKNKIIHIGHGIVNCSHFGCSRKLSITEQLFGTKCIHHSIK